MDIQPIKEQYQQLLRQAKEAKDEARLLQRQVYDLAEALVNAELGKPSPCPHKRCGCGEERILFLGFWECPTSPTGQCVYDSKQDPSSDSCLFCKEPNDRT